MDYSINRKKFYTIYTKLEENVTKCNEFQTNNNTVVFIEGYEGIPDNLLINFIVWLVSTILRFEY